MGGPVDCAQSTGVALRQGVFFQRWRNHYLWRLSPSRYATEATLPSCYSRSHRLIVPSVLDETSFLSSLGKNASD